MTPEHAKKRLAILGIQDIEKLRSVALDLLGTVALCTRRPEDGGYAVYDGGHLAAEGGRDFCIGFAEGRDGLSLYGGRITDTKVMCGEFQVWPEWGG